MKTKTQHGRACHRYLAGTGLFVLLTSCFVSILLLRVVAASPGPVPRPPRPAVTKVECSSLSSAILGRSVSYCVALPEDYAASTARYPTLYFLHGLFENERSWSDRGGQEVLDSLVSQG